MNLYMVKKENKLKGHGGRTAALKEKVFSFNKSCFHRHFETQNHENPHLDLGTKQGLTFSGLYRDLSDPG